MNYRKVIRKGREKWWMESEKTESMLEALRVVVYGEFLDWKF